MNSVSSSEMDTESLTDVVFFSIFSQPPTNRRLVLSVSAEEVVRTTPPCLRPAQLFHYTWCSNRCHHLFMNKYKVLSSLSMIRLHYYNHDF